MIEDLALAGSRHVNEIKNINRELIEKALQMRCVGYLSQIKAHLLTETIFEFDQSKKSLKEINLQVIRQRELVFEQKLGLEKANQELEGIRAELENRVAARTHDLMLVNQELKTEIAHRHQVEEALREKEAFFRAVINSADSNIAVLDREGNIIEVNDAWRSFAKENSQDSYVAANIGDNYLEACRNASGPEAEQANIAMNGILAVLKGESSQFSLEYPCHSPNEKRWFLMRVVPLLTPNGGAVTYHVNISYLKEVEDELRHHKDDLEKLVAARTTELTQLISEMESFSYSIAHDLRGPLRSITSFSQLLLEDAGDKLEQEDVDNLQRVIKAGKHMSELIKDILALSRVSRDSFQVEKVDLSLIANQISDRIKNNNGAREISIIIEPNIEAQGDSRLLGLLLENLIGNAVKYTRNVQHAKIEIGTLFKDQQQLFYVRDNGIGFDMKFANKLFRPFHRLHNTDEFEGTGIGLATVQRIVQRHKGDVWVDAKEGKGAAVYFTLPNIPKPIGQV